MTWQAQVALAAAFAFMGELVLHWFPWRLILRRDLSRVLAYILGVLAFSGPFSLLLLWIRLYTPAFPLPDNLLISASASSLVHRILVAFWACVLAAGGAVILAYTSDHLADVVTQRAELQELDHARRSAE